MCSNSYSSGGFYHGYLKKWVTYWKRGCTDIEIKHYIQLRFTLPYIKYNIYCIYTYICVKQNRKNENPFTKNTITNTRAKSNRELSKINLRVILINIHWKNTK